MRRTLSGGRLVSKVLEQLSNPKFPDASTANLIAEEFLGLDFGTSGKSGSRFLDNLEWRMRA